jgi:hypothetical protein
LQESYALGAKARIHSLVYRMIPDFTQERHPRRESNAESLIRRTIGRSPLGIVNWEAVIRLVR